jgi:hypothetical protein
VWKMNNVPVPPSYRRSAPLCIGATDPGECYSNIVDHKSRAVHKPHPHATNLDPEAKREVLLVFSYQFVSFFLF